MSDNAESRKQVAKDRRAELAKAQARRNAMLALEFPPMRDFDEPALEWRRLFSELFGTFLLVLAGAGGGLLVIQTHGAVTATAAVVAPGLTVMAVILFMGAVSGAHLNPCVSLAFALRRDFPWRRVPGYIVCQLAGAILACLFLSAVFGDGSGLGATRPGVGFDAWQAMLIEAVLTLGLVSTILGTSSGAQNVGPLGALAVGGYVALAGLWSGPVSGASMNPARSFGPDLVTGDFSSLWVYLVGPIVGALLAVVAAVVLRGRGGGVVGRASASGRLTEESLDSVESD
ncbi:MAG: aquaporin [Actinomycetes bacterium]